MFFVRLKMIVLFINTLSSWIWSITPLIFNSFIWWSILSELCTYLSLRHLMIWLCIYSLIYMFIYVLNFGPYDFPYKRNIKQRTRNKSTNTLSFPSNIINANIIVIYILPNVRLHWSMKWLTYHLPGNIINVISNT